MMSMLTKTMMTVGCNKVARAAMNLRTPLGHGGNMQEHPPSIIISCDTCVMRDTTACDDCIVPMLCGEPEAVIFDYEELRTLAALAKAGLTPGLRHQRSA